MEMKIARKDLLRESKVMNSFLLIVIGVLWLIVLFLGFLLLGTLRALGLLKWRLEQLEATTPSRLGRSGLKAGKKAPDFTLTSVAGPEVSLHDFAGRKVLLVFTQVGCGPCQTIMPELNQVGRISNLSHAKERIQVLVVNKGDAETTRKWAGELSVRFPVLIQDGLDISKKYDAFATPFAFLIDEKGVVASKGIISNKQHIGYVLAGPKSSSNNGHVDSEADVTETAESNKNASISSKEVQHV
jgi:methylamine dehydrogenase accessory protein MauD